MPHRHHVVAIILFWVGTTTWLYFRELEPRFRPGEPPPFTFDLADEAQTARPNYWTVWIDGQTRGYARTLVRYRERDDTFGLFGEFKLWPGEPGHGDPDQVVQTLYRVTRSGDLRAVQSLVTVTVQEIKVSVDINGPVKDGQLMPTLHLSARRKREDAPDLPEQEEDKAGQPGRVARPLFDQQQALPPVPVTKKGSVLNPMEPLNRLQGLRKGQHWRIPLVDPLTDAVRALGNNPLLKALPRIATEVRWLNAEVLPRTQNLAWPTAADSVSCLVIEYQGEDTTGHTWVRDSDGAVLRQEITHEGKTLVLQREEKGPRVR